MIYVISGTNRPSSRSLQVAHHVTENLNKYHSQHGLIDIATLPFNELTGNQYGSGQPQAMQDMISRIDQADGLIIVTPEYNGSYPGALKYFIDHWSYPKSFEYRPVAFIGLGFRWGGLRPVEHLQQVFNYRNAFIFPERVFITNIGNALVDGRIVDEEVKKLIDKQMAGFVKFIEGLKHVGLHPNNKNS